MMLTPVGEAAPSGKEQLLSIKTFSLYSYVFIPVKLEKHMAHFEVRFCFVCF